MCGSIENVSQLQKPLNDLQLENQISKNILDKAGLPYHHKEIAAFILEPKNRSDFMVWAIFLSVKFFTTTFYCVKFN